MPQFSVFDVYLSCHDNSHPTYIHGTLYLCLYLLIRIHVCHSNTPFHILFTFMRVTLSHSLLFQCIALVCSLHLYKLIIYWQRVHVAYVGENVCSQPHLTLCHGVAFDHRTLCITSSMTYESTHLDLDRYIESSCCLIQAYCIHTNINYVV